MRRRATAGAAAKRSAGGGEQVPEAHDGASAETDPVKELKELAELREQGLLTEEEFAAEKRKLLEP